MMKKGHGLRGTKDWTPSSSSRAESVPWSPSGRASAPAKKDTTKIVIAIAIVGIVALAVMEETGIINIFASK